MKKTFEVVVLLMVQVQSCNSGVANEFCTSLPCRISSHHPVSRYNIKCWITLSPKISMEKATIDPNPPIFLWGSSRFFFLGGVMSLLSHKFVEFFGGVFVLFLLVESQVPPFIFIEATIYRVITRMDAQQR